MNLKLDFFPSCKHLLLLQKQKNIHIAAGYMRKDLRAGTRSEKGTLEND